MKTNLFAILCAIILFSIPVMTTQWVWCEGYKQARETIDTASRPWFLADHLQQSQPHDSKPVDQSKVQPEWETLLSAYQSEKENSITGLINQIEPYLVTAESKSIQQQVKNNQWGFLQSEDVSFADLISAVYARNPSIQAAHSAWQAAVERYPQAAYLEGILRQYNAFTKTLHLVLQGKPYHQQMVEQEFPFPGSTALRGRIVQTDIEIAKQKYAIAVREVLAEFKKTYHHFIHLDETIAITKESQELFSQMLEVVTRNFEGGNTSYNDVIQTQSTLDTLTNDIRTLLSQQETARVKLNSLLNRTPQEPVVHIPLSHAVPEAAIHPGRLFKLAQENRQEIQLQKSLVQRAALTIQLARERNRPDPSLGMAYFQRKARLLEGSLQQKKSFQSIPKPTVRPQFGETEAYIAEMLQQKAMRQQELEDTIAQTNLAVQKAYEKLDQALRDTNLFRTTLLPEAQQSVDIAETDYLGSRMDFFAYLDAQQNWLEYRLQYSLARHDIGNAFAELERVVGVSLQSIHHQSH